MNNDSLGDRMKAYENAYRLYLPSRLPVIVRIDGRAFHTFTRDFERPFDIVLQQAMQTTARKLCKEVMGCKLAYVQSDEISLLITNDDSIETQPWFGNNLQKLASLTASIATLEFNKAFSEANWDWYRSLIDATKDEKGVPHISDADDAIDNAHRRSECTATFDSRAFILPKEEVCNYFIWRQQDAVRNSIQMVAQSLYSHNELHGKNSSALQEMIHAKGINWNDYPVPCKRGTCIIRKEENFGDIVRNVWVIDSDIPTFTKNRAYIDSRFLH